MRTSICWISIAVMSAMLLISGCGDDSGGPAATTEKQSETPDCTEAPTVKGVLKNDIKDLGFSGADLVAEVHHKLDVDPSEDRCIGHFEVTMKAMGQGCELHLSFDVANDKSGLVLEEAWLHADSFCSGWSDDDEGKYVSTGEGLATVSMPDKVPDAVAKTSCLFAEVTFAGKIVLERADGQTITANLSDISIEGSFTSSGDTNLHCPCASNPPEGCIACPDPSFIGTNCDHCANPNMALPDCTTCKLTYTGPNCDECADPKLTGAACDECSDPKFTGAACDECADAKYTGTDCDECSDPHFATPSCTSCLPQFTGTDCDECSDPKFTGTNCDECPDPKYTGPNCDFECNGEVCLDTTGQWAYIAAGFFTMGSPPSDGSADGDEFPAHVVTLTRAFALQVSEVTQSQWQNLMGNNPSQKSPGCDDCPVETVNWYEALSFCNALSEAEGYESCYTLSGCNGKSPGGDMECSTVQWIGPDCTGYRLPTEAEWEYAYRAGTTTRWYCGDTESCVDSIGWYGSNSSSSKTHAVGGKTANAWGLYDMAGNVWEWCWDWYGSGYYGSSPASDPTGPTSGSARVLRGGSWLDVASYLRAAYRGSPAPGNRSYFVGFRPARSLDP